MHAGRHDEGLDLLHNALVATELNELDDPQYELDALHELVGALFWTKHIDDVKPLVLRFREASKAEMENEGVCFEEFNSKLWPARFHEVMHPEISNVPLHLAWGTPSHCCILALTTTKSRLPHAYPRSIEDTCTYWTVRSLQELEIPPEAASS